MHVKYCLVCFANVCGSLNRMNSDEQYLGVYFVKCKGCFIRRMHEYRSYYFVIPYMNYLINCRFKLRFISKI